MKKIITILLLTISIVTTAQKNVTIVFDHGMSTIDGFVDDGVYVVLPNRYDFYIFGGRNILGIERFDSISQYKLVEKELYDKYQKKLYGDTEVSVEINDSPMFGHCEVIYFYYESAMYTNCITNSWSSIRDGDHTIIIITHEGVYFKKCIRLKDGCLVEQRDLPIYNE
jgi:hypothetical protein